MVKQHYNGGNTQNGNNNNNNNKKSKKLSSSSSGGRTTLTKSKPAINKKNNSKVSNGNRSRSKSSMNNADRSSYFARREAAKVLRSVLHGDAQRRAVASIKSIVFGPSVRNKKATFALVCQTLKHLPILKDVLEISNILKGKWKKQEELMYIITYDILFGQAILSVGDAEKFLLPHKDELQSALAELCDRRKVKCVEDLVLTNHQVPGVLLLTVEKERSVSFLLKTVKESSKPRYVRVNTLKLDVESAFHELEKEYMVKKDDTVPDLLVLPSGTDLHDHPLVINGSVLLQGKASSMVAVALGPEPGWAVLDACAAPGNKTAHLAALMRGNGKILACELNKERAKRLEETIKRSGASNVEVLHKDFLSIRAEDPFYAKVRAILLDPSCSGSGTVADRLDHLLPSYATAQAADIAGSQRVKKLAAFQSKALAHALSFPAVERVVYSTCSIYQTENEDVVKSVLPLAASLDFQLETPFPQWRRRGLPVFEGSQHLLRTDPVEDMEGFFIALFVKRRLKHDSDKQSGLGFQLREMNFLSSTKKNKNKRKSLMVFRFARMSSMMLYSRNISKSRMPMGCRYK